ncbi:aminoglycoside phosphotransferase [Streptomyces sp. CB02923]|uniref:phosphotransferase n=1 Tax=Streptomyces sp. CB02923 TaxID=1718985 RepID=UPI00093E2DCE|nr:phosphotransferase [Streptomyces sp. CB02923]OKH98285.1 aminoglycoside phosphotransferase [Streptomyces sp. CB02923]
MPTPAPSGPARRPVVLVDRPDVTVVRCGRVVVKAHAPDCDPDRLAVRLRIAAHPSLRGIVLPPLPVTGPGGFLTLLDDGRPATRWPYGSPVSPDAPDAAPWEETARLLARLHTVAPGRLPGPVPPMRGPAKAARALARMRAACTTPVPGAAPASALRRAAATVERAWSLLPPWARGEAPPPRAGSLCHGDLHLGQLVRHPADDGPWLLIDIDDLGLGDPAWDLARPAAWFATGLLAPAVWSRFLGAYRAAGGVAVRPYGDPWPELDVPARALTAQTAALAVAKAAEAGRPLDEDERAVVDACGRMASVPRELGAGPEP